MRVILRRIQRAYFSRNRRAGSRATSVAVRHRRRVHAHMHFSAVFHTKTLPVLLGRSRVAEQRRCVGGVRAGPRDRPGAARTGEGWWGGPGFLQRFTGATAGSRHSRPRDSQGAHVGALGGKMRTILRHIQRAYFRRNRHAGSRAPSVAVRYRRRVHAQLHFSAVFHTKTLPVLGRASEGSLAS